MSTTFIRCNGYRSEVDCSFFLVTVDLWSADGTKEMNLVLHPTSADRYTPANAPKSKRRATTSSTAPPSQPSEAQSPVPPTPSTSQYQSVSCSWLYCIRYRNISRIGINRCSRPCRVLTTCRWYLRCSESRVNDFLPVRNRLVIKRSIGLPVDVL